MQISTFYNLNAPGITFTYKGGDLYRPYEHVDKSFYSDMLGFLHRLMIEIGPDDTQTYVNKTKNQALEVLNIPDIEEKNKEEKEEENKKDDDSSATSNDDNLSENQGIEKI